MVSGTRGSWRLPWRSHSSIILKNSKSVSTATHLRSFCNMFFLQQWTLCSTIIAKSRMIKFLRQSPQQVRQGSVQCSTTNSFNYNELHDMLHLPDLLRPRHNLLLQNLFTSKVYWCGSNYEQVIWLLQRVSSESEWERLRCGCEWNIYYDLSHL